MSERRSSSERGEISFNSCEVRKPSKKCRNGMRDSSAASWAMRAKSCASWTALEQSKSGGASGHDVAVVAEYGQSVGGQCAGGNVNNGGRQLTSDLVHVGDH